MVKLADDEKAMLDGKGGPAKQKAMELLVKYAEALNCERFVATNNIAGVPGSSTLFLKDYYKDFNGGNYEAIFSLFDLDSDEVVPVPKVTAYSCHLQGGVDPEGMGHAGQEPRGLRAPARGRGRGRGSRHPDHEDLHALSRRQRAGEGRALRLDGKLGGGVLQLGHRRAHQHRRARKHQRRDAHRQGPRLGLSPRRIPPRHAMPSRSRCRSKACSIGACSAISPATPSRRTSPSSPASITSPT